MRRILLTVLVLLVTVVGAGWFYLDRIAAGVVERGGSSALGVPVTVDSMALSPISGRLVIDGLRVANPADFSDEPLFRLDRGAVTVRPASLLGDVIDIPELALDGLHVRLERRGTATNLGRIAERLRRPGGRASGDGSGDAGGSGSSPRVRVGHLRIAGVEAQVDLGPELGERGRFSVEVPPIEMHELGDDTGGITVAALVRRITAAVAGEVQAAVDRRVERELGREAEQAIERGRQELEQRLRDEAEQLLGQ